MKSINTNTAAIAIAIAADKAAAVKKAAADKAAAVKKAAVKAAKPTSPASARDTRRAAFNKGGARAVLSARILGGGVTPQAAVLAAKAEFAAALTAVNRPWAAALVQGQITALIGAAQAASFDGAQTPSRARCTAWIATLMSAVSAHNTARRAAGKPVDGAPVMRAGAVLDALRLFVERPPA